MFAPFFFFNDTATTEIYTLSLHDALPISLHFAPRKAAPAPVRSAAYAEELKEVGRQGVDQQIDLLRSEEHTSELQSPCNLVCRLLLEKKKKISKCMASRTHVTTPARSASR